MEELKVAMDLIEYIKKAVSPYHAVEEGIRMLTKVGFEELNIRKSVDLKPGGKYYVKPYDTTLFAITIGENVTKEQQFRIAAAHTDQPCLHVKPTAELTSNKYLRVNTEVYGGAILNTWLDRPLSIAGRVALKSNEVFRPIMKLLNVEKAFLTIPNLAIHMNKEVNKGVELMKQTDMLPLMGVLNEQWNEKSYFLNFLAKELKVEVTEIIDFDLYVYCAEEGCILGMDDEFLQSPRLDNLTSCYALLQGIIEGQRENGINVIGLFDNEEIGSKTKQGADSALLSMLLEKIYAGLLFDKTSLNDSVLGSFLLSMDVAHALHPCKSEKYDPVNYALLNEGVVFKISANQRYTFDTEAIASLVQLCDKYNIPYKKFVNHADIVGGGTMGPIISSWLPMKTVDVGVPLLAMHSARELMGRKDQKSLEDLAKAFFLE